MADTATPVQFKKAVKHESKGRIALIGPAGAGKSYTMLVLARALAGPTGKIAAIDTEHGSLSKYADAFDFDVNELDSFAPPVFIEALYAAEDAGYSVFCCDSLSHFWMGKDGALEFVDVRAKRSTGQDDTFAGWKAFRPHERQMVDAILASKMHVICTMRTKNEYTEVEYTDGQGRKKKKRVKIGLAPVQRDGLEYEFDLVGLMDEDNNLVVDKTRCPHYAQSVISKPGARDFAPLIEWLRGTPRETTAGPRLVNPVGTQAAADEVAARKLRELQPQAQPQSVTGEISEWQRIAAKAKSAIGEKEYYRVLGVHGYEKSNQVRNQEHMNAILEDWRKCPRLPAAPKDETPAALKALIDRCLDQDSCRAVISELGEQMAQRLGIEGANAVMNAAIAQYGLAQGRWSAAFQKRCVEAVRDLYQRIHAADNTYQASDHDLGLPQQGA